MAISKKDFYFSVIVDDFSDFFNSDSRFKNNLKKKLLFLPIRKKSHQLKMAGKVLLSEIVFNNNILMWISHVSCSWVFPQN